jgi:hypothetical protein
VNIEEGESKQWLLQDYLSGSLKCLHIFGRDIMNSLMAEVQNVS